MKTFFLKYTILFLLLILQAGCRTNSPTEKYLSSCDNVVDVHDKIVEIPTEETPMSIFSKVYIMDKYLIITDYKSINKLIYLFDKNTFQLVQNVTPIGQGPGEMSNIGNLCTDERNRKFYVFDNGNLKLLSYDLDSVINNPDYIYQTKANLSEKIFPMNCCYISDTLSIVSVAQVIGNWETVHELAGRWNMTTGEIVLGYENSWAEKKRFSFAASEEQGIYVKCYSRYDLMTICNLDGSLRCNVYGPGWTERITDTCHYNMEVCICSDKILALYAGVDHRGNDYPTQIRVFDTNGEYIKTLYMGCHLYRFCYDKENHRIIFVAGDEIQFGYLDLEGII